MRYTTPNLMLLFVLSLASCGDTQSLGGADIDAQDQQVAGSELSSLAEDFSLWDLLEDEGIANKAIRSHVANSMIRHLLILRVADYEITKLKGRPTEALCRATTDEARQILSEFGHKDLRDVALSYVDEVEPVIIAEVRRIQQNMLGEGCFLSPRSKW